MFKYSLFRMYGTSAKRANTKLSKAAVIKRLNYENKALFGAVVKPVKTQKKSTSTCDNETQPINAPAVETELRSEIFWQMRNISRPKTTTNELMDSMYTAAEHSVIPFTEKELKHITKFPIVPSAKGIIEKGWILHEQHESEKYRSPSVNRILSATMSDASRQALLRWKSTKIAELGEEGFAQLQKDIFARGSTLHTTLETWLSGTDPSQEMIQKTGVLWKSIHGALKHVERPARIIEQKLYHPYLHYNGVVDCITSTKGQYHVIEWKSSDNPKANVEATYDAPIQLCAYLGALQANNELSDARIQRGAIFVAYTSGKPANVHILSVGEMRRYWQLWLNRLQEYWTRYRDGTLPEPI
ncbi:mitochondrial genome maintenance exonuclease 1-like [Anopheles maculipalpis]|uniref:mitochondrial genome maintenance exonuclease 1-like n=1 Tax=Anopheles maculipalpis TaxID=1496333 RepID=UPI002158F904|nr:mitochondrial genome maintenance exonuclease 1-like [Anopheles maculipalpis]XP_050067367.1 mitochondrial genome maintenance exonuclease 1-like [Anopheles maculipalpis]